MAIRHEAPKDQKKESNFILDAFLDPNSPEAMAKFFANMESQGYDLDNTTWSGTNGHAFYASDGSINNPGWVFGMNASGWQDVIRFGEPTPLGYADLDRPLPLVAVYDSRLLTEPDAYQLDGDPDDILAAVHVKDIVLSDNPKPVEPNDKVREVVVPMPGVTIRDALLGIVHIEREQFASSKEHGF